MLKILMFMVYYYNVALQVYYGVAVYLVNLKSRPLLYSIWSTHDGSGPAETTSFTQKLVLRQYQPRMIYQNYESVAIS